MNVSLKLKPKALLYHSIWKRRKN